MAAGPIAERNQDATIYVGGLDEKVTDPILWELFLQAGPVVNVHMPKDRITQSHQGYGFVEFMGEEDADYAIKIMNMIKLYGKPIRVNKASAHQKNLDVGANLFIGNLDPEVDEKLLYDTFSAFGVILQIPKIMRDPETGNSKGFAFINFASFEAADAALEAMNGQYLCNRAITISYAFKKDSKGERHGSAAERLLAAQNPLSHADRPHQLFADAPPMVVPMAPPPPPPVPGMSIPPPGMPPMSMPSSSMQRMGMPPPPPPSSGMGPQTTGLPPPPMPPSGLPPPPFMPPPQFMPHPPGMGPPSSMGHNQSPMMSRPLPPMMQGMQSSGSDSNQMMQQQQQSTSSSGPRPPPPQMMGGMQNFGGGMPQDFRGPMGHPGMQQNQQQQQQHGGPGMGPPGMQMPPGQGPPMGMRPPPPQGWRGPPPRGMMPPSPFGRPPMPGGPGGPGGMPGGPGRMPPPPPGGMQSRGPPPPGGPRGPMGQQPPRGMRGPPPRFWSNDE